MSLNVEKELAALQRMTPRGLRDKYAEVFGEESRSGHKAWLVKRIIWRMQANTYGDLSERARQRALELANDADLRLKAPKASATVAAAEKPAAKAPTDHRLPIAGTVLTRKYKGCTHRVTVRPNGLEYESTLYPSLSAVAHAITGAHWNGYLFFRLARRNGDAA